MYETESNKGKIIEFTKICEILEFGIKIIISQNGKIPKLAQIYMFSNVKYS